jgi:hypothetical protein
MHHGPTGSQLEGKLKGLVCVRGQVDPKDVVWVGLLCHGVMSMREERLKREKKDLRKKKKEEHRRTRKMTKACNPHRFMVRLVEGGKRKRGGWKMRGL